MRGPVLHVVLIRLTDKQPLPDYSLCDVTIHDDGVPMIDLINGLRTGIEESHGSSIQSATRVTPLGGNEIVRYEMHVVHDSTSVSSEFLHYLTYSGDDWISRWLPVGAEAAS